VHVLLVVVSGCVSSLAPSADRRRGQADGGSSSATTCQVLERQGLKFRPVELPAIGVLAGRRCGSRRLRGPGAPALDGAFVSAHNERQLPGRDTATVSAPMLALTSGRPGAGRQGQAETAERRTAMRRQPGFPGGPWRRCRCSGRRRHPGVSSTRQGALVPGCTGLGGRGGRDGGDSGHATASPAGNGASDRKGKVCT
jgi:hypothetical protein